MEQTTDNQETKQPTQDELTDEALKALFGYDDKALEYSKWVIKFVEEAKKQDKHKTKTTTEILKEEAAQLDANMKATLSDEDYTKYTKAKDEYYQTIIDGFQNENNAKIDDIHSKIQLGIAMVSIHIMNAKYSIDLFKELNQKLQDKKLIDELSERTRQRYSKYVLTKETEENFSKLNGQNKLELEIDERLSKLTKENLSKINNLSMVKLQYMKHKLDDDQFKKVLNGDDTDYNNAKSTDKDNAEKKKNKKFEEDLKKLNDSIVEEFDMNNYKDTLSYDVSEKELEDYRKQPIDTLIKELIVSTSIGEYERRLAKKEAIQLKKKLEDLELELEEYKKK
jgi:hypothetical protein